MESSSRIKKWRFKVRHHEFDRFKVSGPTHWWSFYVSQPSWRIPITKGFRYCQGMKKAHIARNVCDLTCGGGVRANPNTNLPRIAQFWFDVMAEQAQLYLYVPLSLNVTFLMNASMRASRCFSVFPPLVAKSLMTSSILSFECFNFKSLFKKIP